LRSQKLQRLKALCQLKVKKACCSIEKKNEHMCVFQGLFNSLKGKNVMVTITFCLASLWNASSRGQQKLWPKAFQSHALLISSLSLTILGKFHCKITALEMQSKSSHHKKTSKP
jgi:hypothetical protein